MGEPFEYLKKACGGVLNPETLTDFQRAMREYEEFMARMREFFSPMENDDGGDDEWTGAPRQDHSKERF